MADYNLDVTGLDGVSFGEEIRHKEFCLRPQSVFLNHGSYGTVPRRILDMQKRYLDELESHPDHWFRGTAYGRWTAARQTVADFVGARVEDLFLVVNATQGVNTVLRSCKLSPGDGILASSLTYGSLKILWQDMVENIRPGLEALMIEIKMPIASEEALLQQYDDYLTSHPNVKLVLIDHITSPSAILMPVKRLAAICRKHGALVMVDGAHAPGQLPLHLDTLGVDFYTGNLHKWSYCPRGCALLWVKGEHHSWLQPPQTSWNKGKELARQFFDLGTRDHIPFLCARLALQFYQAIGGMDRIVRYTSDLAGRARDMLLTELGLQRLDIPHSMETPNLRLIRLPGIPPLTPHELMQQVYEEDDIQTCFDKVDGAMYLRISAQVYNTLEDYRKLIPVMKRIMATCVKTDV